MEPGVYASYKFPVKDTRPPLEDLYPKTSSTQQSTQQTNHVPENPRQTVDDDGWNAYSMDVTRGNFFANQDLDDPRTHIGWLDDHSTSTGQGGMQGLDFQSSTPRASDHMVSNGAHKPVWMWDADYGKGLEVNGSPPEPVEHPYPHPDLSLPHPSLNLDFRISVTLNPPVFLGATPFGHKKWTSVSGGTWSGSWGSGIILPSGHNSHLTAPNGSTQLLNTHMLQTHDTPPAFITLNTRGWRTGPPEIMAQLADPSKADSVDTSSYTCRVFIELETGDERYTDKINYRMWIGSGIRKGAEVIYDAYLVS